MNEIDMDMTEDIYVADRGESVDLMEPLLVSESSRHRTVLTDLVVELAAKVAGFRRSLPEGVLRALADSASRHSRILSNQAARDWCRVRRPIADEHGQEEFETGEERLGVKQFPGVVEHEGRFYGTLSEPAGCRLVAAQVVLAGPGAGRIVAENRRVPAPCVPGRACAAYLLKGLAIERPHQVWTADITYIPVQRSFICLVAAMDW